MVPVNQVWCKEKHGPVLRWIYRADSPAEYWRVVQSVRGMPNFLGQGPDNLSILFDDQTDVYLVDHVGAILVCKQPVLFKPGAAHVHVTFWDKILRGREELCRQLANLVIEQERFWYLWTAIPENAGAIRFFARRVGFKPLLNRNSTEYLEYYTGAGV